MNEEPIGVDGGLRDDAASRPLTEARAAVARASEHLGTIADRLAAAEHEDERVAARVREAEERAMHAARALEESAHRVVEAERRAEYAERLVAETGDAVRGHEEQLAAAEELARMADERSRAAEERARRAEERIAAAERRAHEAEERSAATDARAAEDLERRLATAEQRAEEAEERLEIEMARTVELSRRLEDATRIAHVADERADEADERAHVSLERTKQLEAEIDSLRAALEEAKQAPPVTVIVDEARTALQEAVGAEVRRPLSSIMGLTLALKHTDSTTAEGIDMMRQLSMHARKLDRLVAEYLEVDRLIDGTLKPNRRRTDLEALVRRVVDESPDLANIDVRLESSRTTAAVDPILAEQMIEALVANAGRRTAPGGSITVRVSQDASGSTIVVEDAGEPVAPSMREALLDPAQLLRSGAPKGGTGLILMSRLAQIHRGRATVEERPGGGAAFRIFLPAAPADDDGSSGGDRSALQDGAIAI